MNLDLDKLEAAAAAATPGPWIRVAGCRVECHELLDVKDHGHYATWSGGTKAVVVADTVKGHKPERDAEFIAAANPAVVLELVRRLRAAEARAYPETLTPNLAHVLGFMNFRTAPMAHLFRAAGHEIPRKCEDEQAFVLDRMVRAVIEHGEGWADAFREDLCKADEICKSKAAQGASHG